MTEHFPLPWSIDPHALSIYSAETKKGPARVADLRGWGYLTGKGHGALGLSNEDGIAAQRANAELIIKAVNNHDALVKELEAQRDYWADRVTDIAGELQEGEKYSAIMADRIANFSERAEHINGILRAVGGSND